jgi:hypothetical protein
MARTWTRTPARRLPSTALTGLRAVEIASISTEIDQIPVRIDEISGQKPFVDE